MVRKRTTHVHACALSVTRVQSVAGGASPASLFPSFFFFIPLYPSATLPPSLPPASGPLCVHLSRGDPLPFLPPNSPTAIGSVHPPRRSLARRRSRIAGCYLKQKWYTVSKIYVCVCVCVYVDTREREILKIIFFLQLFLEFIAKRTILYIFALLKKRF
jgi:hypothetical protein